MKHRDGRKKKKKKNKSLKSKNDLKSEIYTTKNLQISYQHTAHRIFLWEKIFYVSKTMR